MLFLGTYCNNPTGIHTEQISLDTKIGQMLMIGFRGLEVAQDSSIAKDIKAGRIGGVILFDRDVALKSDVRNIQSPSQVRELVQMLKSYASTKLLVAIDQEGGKICRLKTKYGFPQTVSQQYLGNLNNLDSTRFYAKQTANTLKELGININFAPVIDLNINPENPAIGKIERSFSADPDIVTNHSSIVIEEHKKQNIICSLKHFPGHGSSTSDSHLGFVDVTSVWTETELEPYRRIISSGHTDMIMTAHIFNSSLDPQYPATLSKNIITGILRNSLGFNGVVVSDAMDMNAIADNYGLESAIFLSVNAGVDIILFSNNLIYDNEIINKVTEIIKKLIAENKISEERINESYERIMNLKNGLQ
jgi:beta-N-acetylhexosaminidase